MCEVKERTSSYSVKKIKDIDNGKGYWGYVEVGIFDGDNQIGSYIRNYPGHDNTFYPFQLNDKWYAIYSKDYMYSRVMELPSCKDIAWEDDKNTKYENHFCPVEYYVPYLCVMDFKKGEVDPYPYNPRHDPDKWAVRIQGKNGYSMWYYPEDKKGDKSKRKEYKEACEKCDKEFKEWRDRHPHIFKYLDIAFVSGCPWGLDHTWQVRCFDLSKIEEGVLKNDDRFGWIDLPSKVSLKDSLDFDLIDGDEQKLEDMVISIAQPVYYSLDGKKRED